jgi:branched-chain amino acid aminotransferase
VSEAFVYLNGELLPASEARLNIYDLGVVMGATVTEMTRTFRHRLWRLDRHLDRLWRALRYTRMDVGVSQDELSAVAHELVARNAPRVHPNDDLGVVHFVTAGEHATYAWSAAGPARTTPTVCVHTFPLPLAQYAKKMAEGAHVVTPSIRHVPPQCCDPKMKYRSRMHWYLADAEARRADPEASALLLDLAGNVTETSGANFLIVERGTVVSPTTTNTLPGISRAMVVELCQKLHVPFVERDIQVFDVMNADEAFQTSTPYCVMPVTRINGAPIGDGRPGPLTRRLLAAWSDEVGLDIVGQIRESAVRRAR